MAHRGFTLFTYADSDGGIDYAVVERPFTGLYATGWLARSEHGSWADADRAGQDWVLEMMSQGRQKVDAGYPIR